MSLLLEKIYSILIELRSGGLYASSNHRNKLLGTFKGLIFSLSKDDYLAFKKVIISGIPTLISDRDKRKITYSTLSKIIEHSCLPQQDYDIYLQYEKAILDLANNRRTHYFWHVVTVASTKFNLFEDITNIEDFVIKTYLQRTKYGVISRAYLMDFTRNVASSNKRKFLNHMNNNRPFRDDNIIINRYIEEHKELTKLLTLI